MLFLVRINLALGQTVTDSGYDHSDFAWVWLASCATLLLKLIEIICIPSSRTKKNFAGMLLLLIYVLLPAFLKGWWLAASNILILLGFGLFYVDGHERLKNSSK